MGQTSSKRSINSPNKSGDKKKEEMGVCNMVMRQLVQKYNGLLTMKPKVPIYDSGALTLVYTPGVGASCKKIEANFEDIYKYTNFGNSIALVTDCSDFKFHDDANWNNFAAIPQLEAQCLFYKLHCNIDSYPFIIDVKKCKTEQDYVEVLEALGCSFQGIEVFNSDNKQLDAAINIIKSKNVKFYILPGFERNFIEGVLQEKFIYNEFPSGFITSVIHRACLDARFRGVVPHQIFDFISSNIKEEYIEDKWRSAMIFQNFLLDWLKANNLYNSPQTKEYNISRFKRYMSEGKKAWVQKWPKDFKMIENNVNTNSLALHERFQGMIKITSKAKMKDIKAMYNLMDEAYFDQIEDEIMQNPKMVQELTFKNNWAAIITNGTAVLGFGDITAPAGLPVMEGKSCLFKQLGGVDVVPMCIQEKDPKKLIEIIQRIAPIFSAINLEDIKAPECFEVEQTLIELLDIPVFHDDQHGTAIVVTAAVLNSLKLWGRKAEQLKIVINGGGAAGLSICQMLLEIGAKNIIICDTKGAIYKNRPVNMNPQKDQLASLTNPNNEKGQLDEVLKGADAFIGVSAAGALKGEWIKLMNEKSLILAMANPVPEIYPDEAKKNGAYIVGTGRSDFKNQVNNSLAFPGIFRGAMDVQARKISMEMKLAAARAIANLIPEYELSPDFIIPGALDSRVPKAVATAVAATAIQQGLARANVDVKFVEENINNFILERNLRSIQVKM